MNEKKDEYDCEVTRKLNNNGKRSSKMTWYCSYVKYSYLKNAFKPGKYPKIFNSLSNEDKENRSTIFCLQ